MADKVPVMIYVDPEVESNFTIKPFAAGLAKKGEENPSTSVSASATNLGGGSTDVDTDVDF